MNEGSRAEKEDERLEEACAEISREVYKATAVLERLETEGLITGNGHHARQLLARTAADEIRKRWRPSGSR